MKKLILILVVLLCSLRSSAQLHPYPNVYPHGDSFTLDSNIGGQYIGGFLELPGFADFDSSKVLRTDAYGNVYLGIVPGADTSHLNARINARVKYTDSTITFVTPTGMGDTTLNIWHYFSLFYPWSNPNGYISSIDGLTDTFGLATRAYAQYLNDLKQNKITTGTTSQYFRGDLSLATFPTSLPPSGTAGGDLTGTYPNPTLAVGRVKYSDTSAMLANYLSFMSSVPGTYLHYSDSGAMLNYYYRAVGYGLIGSGHTVSADTFRLSTKNFMQEKTDSILGYTSATYTPLTRTITINGTAHDLSADRTWSVGTVTSIGLVAGTGISISGSTVTSSGVFTVTNTSPSSGGTVTSVTVGSLSPVFTSGTSNSTTTPSTTFALISQTQNYVFASPNGSSGVPSFRALVSSDIPSLAYINSITGGRGITGGTITTSGTLGLDTTQSYTWTGTQTYLQTGLGITVVPGIILSNTTAATSGHPQDSPVEVYSGFSWNATATASQAFSYSVVPTGISNGNPPPQIVYSVTTVTGGTAGIWIFGSNVGSDPNKSLIAFDAALGLTSDGTTTLKGAIFVTAGSNHPTGTSTLSSGTVTVSNNLVTANSLIWVQYQSNGTLSGATLTRVLRVSTQTASTSFVIVAETAPGTTNTSDNSPVQWWIIN